MIYLGGMKKLLRYIRQEMRDMFHTAERTHKTKAIVQGREGLIALVGFRFETAKGRIWKATGKEYLNNLDLNIIAFGHSIYSKEFIFIWVNSIVQKPFVNEVSGEWQKRGVVYWEAMNFLWLGELALERDDF